MKKSLICAVLGATAMLGASVANAQTATRTSDRQQRDVDVTGTVPAFVAQRCAGVTCLRTIPSLGVAF